MKKKTLISFFYFYILLLTNSFSQSFSIPLKLIKRNTDRSFFIPGGLCYLEKLKKPPNGKWKLPNIITKFPIYSRIKLGSKYHLLLFDKSKKELPFYDILYFDGNGNGDLTDEPAIKGAVPNSKNRISFYQRYPNIKGIIKFGNNIFEYPFSISLYLRIRKPNIKIKDWQSLEKYTSLYMFTTCALYGELKKNKNKYKITIADINANGIFGDRVEKKPSFPYIGPRYSSDKIYITSKGKFTYYDGINFVETILIGKDLYNLKIDQPHKKLYFIPYNGKTGKLHLSMNIERMFLKGINNTMDIIIFEPHETIPIPIGQYRINEYHALRLDDGKNPWRLNASFPNKREFVLRIEQDKTKKLIFGEPYFPGVSINIRKPKTKTKRKVSARLVFKIEGKAGENVVDLRCLTYNKSSIPRAKRRRYRPKEPKIIITDTENGKVVYEHTFEYG